jgi:hypothetical protein
MSGRNASCIGNDRSEFVILMTVSYYYRIIRVCIKEFVEKKKNMWAILHGIDTSPTAPLLVCEHLTRVTSFKAHIKTFNP